MGQYYLTVNLDREEFLDPHKLGNGLHLMEFGLSTHGTMTALAILLADGNGRGGGDLTSDNPIVGSWAGDRIVITGDYADEENFTECWTTEELQKIADELGYQFAGEVNLYHVARVCFKDVSEEVLAAMLDDGYLSERLEEKYDANDHATPFRKAMDKARKEKCWLLC